MTTSNESRLLRLPLQETMPAQQRGAVLFVSLIILALITMLGTQTLSTGMNELKLANNTDIMMESVQNADAGVGATMSLINTANDPFNGTDNNDPFANFSNADHPLKNLSNVAVATSLTRSAGVCSRKVNASSSNTVACEYYEVLSRDIQANTGVTTTVRQGVSREVIAN